MQPVHLYTSPTCGYCHAAKRMLKSKGVKFTEIDVSRDSMKKQQMIQKTGRRTVPQIYIGQTHVGGFDDMNALEHAGKLDALLAG